MDSDSSSSSSSSCDSDGSCGSGGNCDSDDSHDSDDDSIGQMSTPTEILCRGLSFAGHSEKQIGNSKPATHIDWFNGQCGADHIVVAHIWEDLQTTHVDGILPIPQDKLNLEHFLMSLCFLRKCPTEQDRECKFNVSHATVAKWTWCHLEKIQALKRVKIVWDNGEPDDIWSVSVDGTHCWIDEPKHPTLSQDSACHSHKCNKAGIDCEFGISLTTGHLVWMSGPHPAGDCSDLTVFTLTDGPRDKLKAPNKRGIAGGGCVGHDELSTPNAHDEKVVGLFGSRALKRHENFNGMTKHFKCLDGRLRHSLNKFAICFESVTVICQCRVEHGEPLCDILTPSVA